MIATPDPAIVAALALTAGLAASSRRARHWRRSEALPAPRYWLPWLMLAVLAVTSTTVVMSHHRRFAAAAHVVLVPAARAPM